MCAAAVSSVLPAGNLRQLHVTAVVVSYNRKQLLGETLHALRKQTVLPDRVIVVDNASDDGAAEYAADALELWGDRARLIVLEENTGGAGGFTVGVAAALLPDSSGVVSDWVWVMDDDTVPHPEALEKALLAHRKFAASGRDSLAVMGSRVEWVDGSDHPMNTPKPKLGARSGERQRAVVSDAMQIRSISFVSAFLRTSRVRTEGLPIADYFLWNDDFEYSARLLKGARGLFVPDSVVTHKTKQPGSSDSDPGARFFFEVRNKLWVFGWSRALYGWERAAYRAATARRWVRTLKASDNRLTLLRHLRDGILKAAAGGPRKNATVLAFAGVPKDVMAVIQQLDSVTFRRR